MTSNDRITPLVNQERENKLVNLSLTPLEEPKVTGLKLDGEIALYRTDTQEELVLNTIDGNDTIWVVRDIDGWWTLPEIELPNLVRGRGDGSYDATGRYSERIITLEGSFLPQGPSGASTARDSLINILSPLTKGQDAGYLIVDENDGPEYEISGRRLASFSEIANVVGDGTNVVFTTQESDHAFIVGDAVSISDVVTDVTDVANNIVSAFNFSSAEITAISDNTFTVVSSVQETYVSGGEASHNFITYTTSETIPDEDIKIGDYIVSKEYDSPVVVDRSNTSVTVAGALGVDYISSGGLKKRIRKASKVRLLSRPVITSVTPRGRHDFSLALKAVDPIKYEFITGDPNGYDTEVLTAGVSGTASATITNSGNEAVPIIIEISQNLVVADSAIGSCPRIQIGSEFIDIVAGTDANVQLEIDTYNREALEVTYNGGVVDLVENGRSNLSVLVDWLYLQPGDNTVTLARFPQGTTCTIYYRSGWIG